MKLPGIVLGIKAARARPTFSGAFWLASVVSLPMGVLGFGVDWLIRAVN